MHAIIVLVPFTKMRQMKVSLSRVGTIAPTCQIIGGFVCELLSVGSNFIIFGELTKFCDC